MRKYALLTVLSLLACAVGLGQEPESYSREFQRALRRGAKAKVTVKVADESGQPVTNANMKVYFRMSSGKSDGERVRGSTDDNGVFSAEGRTTDIVFIGVEKSGYYTSRTQHNAQSLNPARLQDDRWLPWNPTIPVVLKRIQNPTSMILKFAHMRIPQFDEPLGFDLEKHDWVAPDGQGEVPDMLVKFETIDDASPFRKLVVEFPGEMNGAYVRKKDDYSILKSDYHAMTNGVYEARIENNDGTRGPAHILLGGGDYLVFRVRCKVDDKGRLISAHYGKIYGPFDYFVQSRNKMRLSTMFNPVENDTNLEFDGNGWDDVLFGR